MSSGMPPAVSLPNTVVKHVLGDSDIQLAEGDLQLYVSSPQENSARNSEEEPSIMTLLVGEAAFPLFKSTLFGTLADDETVYVFSPPIMETEGYVKIILPEEVKDTSHPSSALRDTFEEVLIQHGLLKEGIEAAGDEVGRSVREQTYRFARRIQDAGKEYLRENPPTKSPTEVPNAVHTVTSTSESATESLFRAASLVTSAVGSAASSAGSWVTAHVVPATEQNTKDLNAVSNAYDFATDGISSGSADVRDSISNTAGSVLENDLGSDVRLATGNVVQSVGNVTGVAGQVVQITSGATVTSGALKGAVSMENKQQAEKGEQKVREESGEWDDLPV